MAIDPNAPRVDGSGSPPPDAPPADAKTPPAGKDAPPATDGATPPPDYETFLAEAEADAAAAAEFAKNPDGLRMVMARAAENMRAISHESMMDAESGFGEVVSEGHEAVVRDSADHSDSMTVVHERAMSAADMMRGARAGDATALYQLNKTLARLGIGTGAGGGGKPTPTVPGKVPTGNPPGTPGGMPTPSGTPGAPGKPTTGAAAGPHGSGGGSAVPRQLTSAQRHHLAHALRQKLEHPPEGMTDEMRQNMELWAQALEGEGEIPEEMALAMIRPEETDEEEGLTRDGTVEGEGEGEGEGSGTGEGGPGRTRTRTHDSDTPTRSRTDVAIAYMSTHPPSARGTGGGNLTREEKEELLARITGSMVSFLGGEEGAETAGAMGHVHGLRALEMSGEVYIGGNGVMRLRRHGGSAGDPVDFGAMVDPDGVATREGAGLDESIAHGGIMTLSDGSAASLWQVGYGEFGNSGGNGWAPVDTALSGGIPPNGPSGEGSPIV